MNSSSTVSGSRNPYALGPPVSSSAPRCPVRYAGAVPRRTLKAAMSGLRDRLLCDMLRENREERLVGLLRTSAAEAEALAWLTPFPLLFFPALFEERVNAVRGSASQTREH